MSGSEGGPTPPRPVPVRDSLPVPESTAPPGVSPESAPRIFVGPGERWQVVERGSTRTGTGSDAGARLLRIEFAPLDSPAAARRGAWVPADALSDLSDEVLEEAFLRSSSVSE